MKKALIDGKHLTFSSKTNDMKAAFTKRVFSLLLAPAFLFAFTSKIDKANYSGEWKLNASKSELGQFEQFAVRSIKAEQKDESIAITRIQPSFNGDDMTSTETLTFDGKEVESTIFENSKRKATAKWADDGKSLTISYTLLLDFNGQSMEIKGTDLWTVSDDGKTLTVLTKSTSAQGDFSWKAVYDKQ
jgi:hypothetical protein